MAEEPIYLEKGTPLTIEEASNSAFKWDAEILEELTDECQGIIATVLFTDGSADIQIFNCVDDETPPDIVERLEATMNDIDQVVAWEEATVWVFDHDRLNDWLYDQ